MPQRKYLVLSRCQPGQQGQSPSPEQMQQMYAAFHAWKEKFKDNILDLGDRLKPGGKVLTAAGVADGPFVEAKEIVGGYMIISAADDESAVEVARACPGSQAPGNSMEIREMVGL
ncbi:MAG: YciI family protein [Myxococcota bacterium]